MIIHLSDKTIFFKCSEESVKEALKTYITLNGGLVTDGNSADYQINYFLLENLEAISNLPSIIEAKVNVYETPEVNVSVFEDFNSSFYYYHRTHQLTQLVRKEKKINQWIDKTKLEPEKAVVLGWCFFVESLLLADEFCFIHSGCVSYKNEGTLFVANANQGKSTLSLLATIQGYDYLSDDQLALKETSEGVKAFRALHWPTIWVTALDLFPEIKNDIIKFSKKRKWDYRNKIEYPIAKIFPNQIKNSCSPKTLFFLNLVDDSKIKIEGISKQEALFKLLDLNKIKYAPNFKTKNKNQTIRNQLSCFFSLIEQVECLNLTYSFSEINKVVDLIK